MVYLFETDRKYFDDNTEGKTVSITGQPLSFGKDFFALTTASGSYVVSTDCPRYIVEDSDLWKKTKG